MAKDKKTRLKPAFSIHELKEPAFEIRIDPKDYAPGERIRVFRSREQAETWIKSKSKKWLAKNAGKIAG